MISLSQLFAANTVDYINSNYYGQYDIFTHVTAADYQLPAIVIGGNNFVEISPDAGVYQGVLSVAIITQIDDVDEWPSSHDYTANHIHSLLSDTEKFKDFFNTREKGTLWGIVHTSLQTTFDERMVQTITEFNVFGQTLKA